MFTQTLERQEGIWIDADMLQKAGLEKLLQIVIHPGMIWLVGESEFIEPQAKAKLNTKFRSIDEDPLIGMFEGSETLSQDAEEILQKEIVDHSGFTWKK